MSANLGAREVIGMVASGMKYGIMTVHFYWVGAIFAMVFLGVFMMPFYYGSRARTVPEYLAMRFDEKTRLQRRVVAVMTVFSSGISLYALARLLEVIVGWNFDALHLGRRRHRHGVHLHGRPPGAVYNEVLQFFLIVLGLSPLVIVSIQDVGGWSGIVANLKPEWTHAWRYMDQADHNPMGLQYGPLLLGLGFAMSFGYWCTDFLVVQRAMIARNLRDAQRTPILAALPKMLMPVIVVLPGLIAAVLVLPAFQTKGFVMPLDEQGGRTAMALPALIAHYY
ncbi:MAG: hypothetical protein U0V64_15155 [Cyclobacteriaceae bacterium]